MKELSIRERPSFKNYFHNILCLWQMPIRISYWEGAYVSAKNFLSAAKEAFSELIVLLTFILSPFIIPPLSPILVLIAFAYQRWVRGVK